MHKKLRLLPAAIFLVLALASAAMGQGGGAGARPWTRRDAYPLRRSWARRDA